MSDEWTKHSESNLCLLQLWSLSNGAKGAAQVWLNNLQCNSVINRLPSCTSCLHCQCPHCLARVPLKQQQSCSWSGTGADRQVTHIICVGSLAAGRDRWILGKEIACAVGKTVPNGFTLQKVMACHRLRTAKHSAAAHALSGSRMGTGRKRVRKGHVEQQRGRKGPPPSLLLQTSVWVSDTTLNLHTGPLLSQLARGLLDSRQLAQPQSSHLGQAVCSVLSLTHSLPALPFQRMLSAFPGLA